MNHIEYLGEVTQLDHNNYDTYISLTNIMIFIPEMWEQTNMFTTIDKQALVHIFVSCIVFTPQQLKIRPNTMKTKLLKTSGAMIFVHILKHNIIHAHNYSTHAHTLVTLRYLFKHILFRRSTNMYYKCFALFWNKQ